MDGLTARSILQEELPGDIFSLSTVRFGTTSTEDGLLVEVSPTKPYCSSTIKGILHLHMLWSPPNSSSGMHCPACVRNAHAKYVRAADMVLSVLRERCIGDFPAEVPAEKLEVLVTGVRT